MRLDSRSASHRQGLAVHDEITRGRQERRQLWVALLDADRPHRPVADAGVPAVQELLRGMRPAARDEQLELHDGEPTPTASLLRKADELPAEPFAAMRRIGGQQAELADTVAELPDADASDLTEVTER